MVQKVNKSASRRVRPSAGDFTGREKAQQAAEQREELAKRDAEVSMMNRVQAEYDEDGVYDPQTNAVIGSQSGRQTVVVVDDEEDDEPRRGVFQDEPILTGKEAPEEVPNVLDTPIYTRPQRLKSAFSTIRIDVDVENMTYGVNNEFNFKEGRAYRVPTDLAEHLNERGLVRQWIS